MRASLNRPRERLLARGSYEGGSGRRAAIFARLIKANDVIARPSATVYRYAYVWDA